MMPKHHAHAPPQALQGMARLFAVEVQHPGYTFSIKPSGRHRNFPGCSYSFQNSYNDRFESDPEAQRPDALPTRSLTISGLSNQRTPGDEPLSPPTNDPYPGVKPGTGRSFNRQGQEREGRREQAEKDGSEGSNGRNTAVRAQAPSKAQSPPQSLLLGGTTHQRDSQSQSPHLPPPPALAPRTNRTLTTMSSSFVAGSSTTTASDNLPLLVTTSTSRPALEAAAAQQHLLPSYYPAHPHQHQQQHLHPSAAAESSLRRRQRPWLTATARGPPAAESHTSPASRAIPYHQSQNLPQPQSFPQSQFHSHLHPQALQQQQQAYLPSESDWYMPGASFPTSLSDTYSPYQQSPQRESYLRESSVSTVTTNGPDSPAPQLTSFPYIATQDPPSSAIYNWADESLPPQQQNHRSDNAWYLQQQGYWPAQVPPVSAPISALKNMAISHHNSASSDDVPDFMSSSRRSESTQGNNTPDTPGVPTGEDLEKAAKMPPNNGTRNHPFRSSLNAYSRLADLEYQGGHVQLYRTESAACQDELFNPANFEPPPSTPQQPSTNTSSQAERKTNLSPKGNLVNERVRTANSIRSQSPAQTATREPSPFRQGAEFAPKPSTHSHSYSPPSGSVMPSAASIRQQQKESAARQEYNRPNLKREVTETISPKDALLDAPPELDGDKTLPAFTDTIPDGYQKHLGGSETYPTNFVSGTNQAFGQFVPLSQPVATNMGGFRGVDLNNWLVSPMPAPQPQVQPTASQSSDKNPEFPAHLITMESSISDNVPASSQESLSAPAIKRPSQTSANTGTYVCVHPGCVARFDGPSKLHKHRREAHPPTVTQRTSPSLPRDSTNSTNATETDENSASPEPVGSAMDSSALLARNSQTGPHKCTRINPQTGKPCNSIFSRPYDLTRHEDTIHDGKKQKVRCEYCYEERTFSRNDALTRHMRVVHPEIDFQGKRGRR